MRQKRIASLVVLLACGLIDFGGANAQSGYPGARPYENPAYGMPGPRIYDGSLLPFEVMRIVRSHGLAPLSRPARREAYYEVIAATRSGGQMRVIVDAFTGDIVKVNPLLAGGPNGPRLAAPNDQALPPRPIAPDAGHRGVAPNEPDPSLGMAPYGRFDGPPVPPRPVPGPRTATAPVPDANAITPPRPPVVARTPMPRPRPAVAEAAIVPPTLAGAVPTAAPVEAPKLEAPKLEAPKPEAPKPISARPAPAPVAPPAVPARDTVMIPVAPLE